MQHAASNVTGKWQRRGAGLGVAGNPLRVWVPDPDHRHLLHNRRDGARVCMDV